MGKKKPKASGKKPADKPTGCYVLSLSVENVRCFGPKQTLDCSDGQGRPRQWTVILGDNGAGKTTLLQSIAGHERSRTGFEDPKETPPRIVNQAWLFVRGTDGSQLAICDLLTTDLETLHSQPGRTQAARWRGSEFGASYGGQHDSFRVCGYGPNRSQGTPEARLSGQTPSATDTADTLMRPSATLPDAESWLLTLDYSTKVSKEHGQKSLLAEIERLLAGVLPGVSAIQFEGGSGVFPQPHVLFKTDFGWVPLRQLGHGYQTMIAWVVDFVSRMVERYPDSPNPLAEPAVCLVDEIDLHLHPVWQRKVIGYLSERFPNTQFIVTAHSPLVVQAAASADANIAVLVRSDKPGPDGHHHVEIRNNPEDVRNWRLDQILTSDLFGGLSLNPPKVQDLFKEKEHLAGLKRLTTAQKARLVEVEAELAKLPVGDDAREVKEMQAIRDALEHLQKHAAK